MDGWSLIALMRRLRRTNSAAGSWLSLTATGGLNLEAVLTPEPRVPSQTRQRVLVA